MGTQILNDIYKDLKLLITSITGFEPSEEGFRICEKFVVSNIKYHTYLSVNSNTTKKAIEDVKEKFITHGKYNFAKRFTNLVDTFLTSFNFDQHPQHDIEWSLLFLLLNLSSTETNLYNKIDHDDEDTDQSISQRERTLSPVSSENNEIENNEIDWSEYLKEGQEDFFCDYRDLDSSDEFTESEDELINDPEIPAAELVSKNKSLTDISPSDASSAASKSLEKFMQIVKSQKWLDNNIENNWWNSAINIQTECKVLNRVPHATLCRIYNDEILNPYQQLTGLITEYQACREILWMFHIPVDMTVFERNFGDFSVRPNISIPSLTPTAFHNICSRFCDSYSAIQQFKSFDQELYDLQVAENSENLPPLTYETYNAAIKQCLDQIKKKIIEVEKETMQQDGITTLLTLSQDLKSAVKQLKVLYEVHKSLNFEAFRATPNWEKTFYLISSLYRELENSQSTERTNLCACLYLASLRVYLNIIDTWLSEGRLEDFRTEFLVAKPHLDTSSKTENESNKASFTYRLNADQLKADPVLEKLFKKVEEMGRSIELLVTLNRISDMWRLNKEQYTVRIPLNDELITQVLTELSSYSTCPEIDEPDVTRKSEFADKSPSQSREFGAYSETDEPDVRKTSEFDAKSPSQSRKFGSDLEDNIQQQVLRINNPFLMKVFQDYLPSMDLSTGRRSAGNDGGVLGGNSAVPFGDTVDSEMKENKSVVISDWGIKVFNRLQKISPFILPISKILGGALEKILDRRYSCASKLVKDILINEYKLEKHLKLMRSIYMMERGHVMKKFYNQMFQEIETNICRLDADYLTNILEEVLSDEWRDTNSSTRWSITLENNCTRQVLQAVERTTLHYSIDWPINMILTDQVLAQYNQIFRFQLKLKWALWALNSLQFVDLEGKDTKIMKDIFYHFNARRLECLRFWLLHAIGSIHTYLSGQVLQSLGMIFEKSLAEANDLDAIIQLHGNYLNKVYEHCLLTEQFGKIMETINKLLAMCANIRDRWERGVKQLLPNELDSMESSYTKHHTYLALALHNAVQQKEAHYYESNPLQYFPLIRDLLTEIAHQSYPPSGICFSKSPRSFNKIKYRKFITKTKK